MALTIKQSEKQKERQQRRITPKRPRITREEIDHLYDYLWDNEQGKAELMTTLAEKQPHLSHVLNCRIAREGASGLTRTTTLATLIAWKAFDDVFPNLPSVSCCESSYIFDRLLNPPGVPPSHQDEAIARLNDIVCEEERETGGRHADHEVQFAFLQSALLMVLSLDSAAARLHNEMNPALSRTLKRLESECPHALRYREEALRRAVK